MLILLLISSITKVKINGLSAALSQTNVHLELIRHTRSYYYSSFGVALTIFTSDYCAPIHHSLRGRVVKGVGHLDHV